jgi:hypothetical protein
MNGAEICGIFNWCTLGATKVVGKQWKELQCHCSLVISMHGGIRILEVTPSFGGPSVPAGRSCKRLSSHLYLHIGLSLRKIISGGLLTSPSLASTEPPVPT